MPTDVVGRYVDGLSDSGPEWLLAGALILIIGYVVWRVVPMFQESRKVKDEAYVKKVEAEIAIEKAREERKAEESRERAQRDIERSASEGRWIQLGEQMVRSAEESNRSASAIAVSMDALRASIDESREGSKRMAQEVHDTHEVVMRLDPSRKQYETE